MAAVEVTITGLLFDKLNRTTQNVVLIGEATLTGLGVGGGPVIPPPSPGYPAHPIAPGGPPPTVWPGPGHPAHPIVLPPEPPTEPPVEPPTEPPSINWVWGYTPEYGWHPVYVPGPGESGPK